MKAVVNLMLLKVSSGSNEDGSAYYYGNFLDKDSGSNFNLYFEDNHYLQKLEPYKDYQIPIVFYQTSYILGNGNRIRVWKISIDKEKIK